MKIDIYFYLNGEKIHNHVIIYSLFVFVLELMSAKAYYYVLPAVLYLSRRLRLDLFFFIK